MHSAPCNGTARARPTRWRASSGRQVGAASAARPHLDFVDEGVAHELYVGASALVVLSLVGVYAEHAVAVTHKRWRASGRQQPFVGWDVVHDARTPRAHALAQPACEGQVDARVVNQGNRVGRGRSYKCAHALLCAIRGQSVWERFPLRARDAHVAAPRAERQDGEGCRGARLRSSARGLGLALRLQARRSARMRWTHAPVRWSSFLSCPRASQRLRRRARSARPRTPRAARPRAPPPRAAHARAHRRACPRSRHPSR